MDNTLVNFQSAFEHVPKNIVKLYEDNYVADAIGLPIAVASITETRTLLSTITNLQKVPCVGRINLHMRR